MTQSSARTGSGTLGLAAAILTTLGLAYLALVELTGAGLAAWPYLDGTLVGMLLGIVAIACAVAATVDCWLSLNGTRRRHSRSYLRGACALLVVACLVGGPLLAMPLVPGLVLTWLAAAQLGTAVPQSGKAA